MKVLFTAVAALFAVASAPTSAAAAPAPQERTVVRETVTPGARNTRVVVRERTTTTRRNWNRPRYRWRSVCRATYRYGERRRVCRRVRYRY